MNTVITQAEKVIWSDAYRFWERYVTRKITSDFWDNLVADADKICDKHKGDKFFSELIYACVNDIEKRYKKG